MSSAGTSGTSDTGQGNPLNARSNAAGMPDDTVEVIEVVEVSESQLSPEAALAFEQDTLDRALWDTGFRWWYVPAIGLPVVVGAGAAIWYFTKGEQPFLDAYYLVTRRSAKARIQSRLRQRVKAARKSARNLPSQTEDLRERLADTWDDARDTVLDLWDTMTDRETLEQVRDRANEAADTAREQLAKVAVGLAAASATAAAKQKAAGVAESARGKVSEARRRADGFDVGDWLAGLGAVGGTWFAKNQAQDLKAKAKDGAGNLRGKAVGQLRETMAKGTLAGIGGKSALTAAKVSTPVAAKAVTTKAKTEHAAKKTGRKVNRFWRQSRAFTFGMLVTATVTYIRTWRMRLDEKNLRETAGGRMVRDA